MEVEAGCVKWKCEMEVRSGSAKLYVIIILYTCIGAMDYPAGLP